jgi:hypothetical protein
MHSFNNRAALKRPYGPPHKVMMNLAVMVMKYDAIELKTPVCELFRLGTLESIAYELRLPPGPISDEKIRTAGALLNPDSKTLSAHVHLSRYHQTMHRRPGLCGVEHPSCAGIPIAGSALTQRGEVYAFAARRLC